MAAQAHRERLVARLAQVRKHAADAAGEAAKAHEQSMPQPRLQLLEAHAAATAAWAEALSALRQAPPGEPRALESYNAAYALAKAALAAL